jgi:predicted nucleic acid-binding protein
LSHDPNWIAPAHLPIEVLRTIRRYESAAVLTPEQAGVCASEVIHAEVRYAEPARWLQAAVWRYRHNISPYDAPYAALAARFGIPLVTSDKRLATAAGSLGVDVMVPEG